NQQLAAARAELERVEQADVAAAAKAIRSGEAPGSLSARVTKQRHTVEVAERNAAALGLASEAAQTDLAATMREHSASCVEELERETVEARQRAVDAIAKFESAVGEMGSAAGAAEWVRSGASDDRWDRRVPSMIVGTIAESSRRRTANGEPLGVDELVEYLGESLEPPRATPGADPRRSSRGVASSSASGAPARARGPGGDPSAQALTRLGSVVTPGRCREIIGGGERA